MSIREIRALDNFLSEYRKYEYQHTYISRFDIKELKDLLKEYADFDLDGFCYSTGILVNKDIYEAIKKARWEADISYMKAWSYFEDKRIEREKKVFEKLKLIPA